MGTSLRVIGSARPHVGLQCAVKRRHYPKIAKNQPKGNGWNAGGAEYTAVPGNPGPPYWNNAW